MRVLGLCHVLVVASVVVSGCYKWPMHQVDYTPLKAKPQKALVVFVFEQQSSDRGGIRVVDASGRFVGDIPENIGHAHFVVTLEPGQHRFYAWYRGVVHACIGTGIFCSYPNIGVLDAELQARRIYFVQLMLAMVLCKESLISCGRPE